MSASAVPRQGDHVFNAVETAIIRPFESIRSMRSNLADGEHFLHDYLLHSYSLARNMMESPILVLARQFVATAGAEEDALREIMNLRPRYPSLAQVAPSTLRDVHLRNSDRFGDATARFEFEVLSAVQQSLETAVAPKNAAPTAARTSSPSIACQQMLSAAYDPAAALVVLTASMARENPSMQPAFHKTIVGIAETLDRPAMWKDAYTAFRDDRVSATGNLVCGIRDVLGQMDVLKAQSLPFAALIRDEIGQKARPPQTDAVFGGMLHLIYTRLQQMHVL